MIYFYKPAINITKILIDNPTLYQLNLTIELKYKCSNIDNLVFISLTITILLLDVNAESMECNLQMITMTVLFVLKEPVLSQQKVLSYYINSP